MKVVIQCAASKHDGGTLVAADGRAVSFVARPELMPVDDHHLYARPDDPSDDGHSSWRTRLLTYNRDRANPLRLLSACELYKHPAYSLLTGRFGEANVFVLSAGWGLIPSAFLTPPYDITFSKQGARHAFRGREPFHDFRLVPDDGEPMTFLGGKEYHWLFRELTVSLKAQKTVMFNARMPPELPLGFTSVRYETRTRTNWHYEAARALAAGDLEPTS